VFSNVFAVSAVSLRLKKAHAIEDEGDYGEARVTEP
jgi:hypothetical protein